MGTVLSRYRVSHRMAELDSKSGKGSNPSFSRPLPDVVMAIPPTLQTAKFPSIVLAGKFAHPAHVVE